jgi:hypothetical protein
MFDTRDMQGAWCEECFDIGLHKDMNEHFKNTVEQELKEMKEKIIRRPKKSPPPENKMLKGSIENKDNLTNTGEIKDHGKAR